MNIAVRGPRFQLVSLSYNDLAREAKSIWREILLRSTAMSVSTPLLTG